MIWAGLLLGAFLGSFLWGCGPKRVVRTDPAAESISRAETAQGESSKNISGDNLPGEPDSGLPDPQYRGAGGKSSLEMPPSDAASEIPPGTPAPTPEPLTGSRLGLEAASLAKKQLGKPYKWGAEGPDKFDCSGLVLYVYKNLGVNLPRVSGMQAYAGVHVDRKDLQPGDLVFFQLNGSRIDHVGIYVGYNKFVHAPRKHLPVKTESLKNSYWGGRYRGARRLS